MNKHTAALLEQYFDIAFASLEGVTRLRELILTLAMQGKLVEQDPKDQPARELLEEIKRTRRHEGTKGRKRKELPPVSAEEMPYELPESWEWVRLGEIAIVNGGFAFKSSQYTKEGVRIIRISDFDEKGFKNGKIVRYPYSSDLDLFILELDNILMAMTGGTVGKSLLVKSLSEPMFVNQRVATIKIIKDVVPEFINGLIRTDLIQSVIQDSKNSTNDNISMGDITGFFVPLPPLAEQHRIVAKIDELMARCDALETLHQQHEEKRLQVHTAAIHQLLEPNLGGFVPSCEPFDFLAKHFSELYSVPKNVAELRKAILQLAVMGRLVPQNPDDPPASQLLEEIRTEKKRLIAEGKIKKQKPLPAIKPEEIPYEIPESWEWVYVNNLTDVGTGATPETINPEYYGGHIPWYTSSATNNSFAEIPEKFITEKALAETNCKIFPSGSLIIAMYGQGKTRGQVSEIVIPGATNQALAAMVFFESSKQSKDYLKYFFTKIYEEIRMLAEGAAQPNLNVGKIKHTVIPLPPLSEQQRIVTKIDQLMALCDQLDEQITARNEKQTELLNAVMGQV
ncbi:MAG: restriction endonuclease subunit S [Desulfomicrobium sp.]|nr:restriction endonuclease subunit S [Desulfomicrobium sp.]